MEIKEIINEVALLLRLTDLEGETALDDLTLLSAQAQSEVSKLIRCINLTAYEVASEYLPLKTAETITVANGQFDLTTLSKTIFKPIALNGKHHGFVFQSFGSTLYAKDGAYTLEYSYLPEIFVLEDDMTCFGGALTLPAFCYGVCAAYCMIGGTFDEAELWESKFKSCMLTASRSGREVKIKRRRWI